MRPVLVLRPEPGNSATCGDARALGLLPIAAPLFEYAPRQWALPEMTRWDGLLIGSAAVFAHAGAGLDTVRAIPVHAVGAATARAATTAGFTVTGTGNGGLQPLVTTLPPGRYLRLAGEAHVALTPPDGVTVDDVIVYATRPQPLPATVIDLIRRGPVLALLHSAEAARHFAGQCTVHDLPRQRIALACLGPRIGAAAGNNWQQIGIAQSPDNDAVLSLAQQMCQTV
jgi:uroporphyrinogen-III synthase